MLPEVLTQDIGEVELQYLHYPGDGPALVLLHATGFLPWLWHPIARELVGDFRVIAPYFCDHRVFDPEEGGLSWLLLASDLTTFIRRLEIDEPYIVGHSMGATVAAIAEAHMGPLASRMMLIEPILLPSGFYEAEITVEQHPLASKSIRRRNAWSDEEEAREYLGEKDLFANWDREMLDLYLQHGMSEADGGALTLACSPRREAALFMGGMEIDPWPLLEKVACPVLLVEGEKSENRLVIDLSRAASIIPNADLEVVTDARHLVPMEKPREVLALIREFGVSRSIDT
ncbi:MAG: alpha/beta hydrolase [Actinobacteria bacterium]|nr:alpha/beta hydrolase [Actinomycetota bacterium]